MTRLIRRRRPFMGTRNRRRLEWVRLDLETALPSSEPFFAVDLLSDFTIGTGGLSTFPGLTVMRTIMKARYTTDLATDGFTNKYELRVGLIKWAKAAVSTPPPEPRANDLDWMWNDVYFPAFHMAKTANDEQLQTLDFDFDTRTRRKLQQTSETLWLTITFDPLQVVGTAVKELRLRSSVLVALP